MWHHFYENDHHFYENESYMIFPSKKISGSYLKQNNSDMVFSNLHYFLKNEKVCSWSCDQNVMCKIMNYPFLNTNFELSGQGKCWKDDVVTFTANLSVTIKRLTKIQAKTSFCRYFGGQEYALQHHSQYKSYYFVEKSKCHIISPLNVFPLKLRV